MGYIYMIKNTINDKIYIGQTQKSLDERFEWYKYNARNHVYGSKNKLYPAMNLIGIDNFYIEMLVENHNISELTKLESYYINEYDSINKGYNCVMPNSTYNVDSETIENIIYDYILGESISDLAIKYDKTYTKIVHIVSGHNRSIEYEIDKSFKPIEIVIYDLKFNPIHYFKSIKDGLNWLHTKMEFTYDKRSAYSRIKIAANTGRMLFNHRWQLASDLVYDDKVFRTKFDKEAYIQGKPAYQPEGKQYYIVDGALDSILNKYSNKHKNINACYKCGKIISRHAKMCVDCSNKSKVGSIKGFSKEAIVQAIDNSNNFNEAAKILGITSGTLKYYRDKYNIK